MNNSKSVFKRLVAEGKMIPADKLRPLTKDDLVVGGAVASAGLAHFGSPFVDIPAGLELTIIRLEDQEHFPDPRIIFTISADGDSFEFNAPYPYDQLFGISP